MAPRIVGTALLGVALMGVAGCGADEEPDSGPPKSALSTSGSPSGEPVTTDSEPPDPRLAKGSIAPVPSCEEFVPTDPALIGPDPVGAGNGDSHHICAFQPDPKTLMDLPEAPAFLAVDFRLVPSEGARDFADIEALFERAPDALATFPGETVVKVEEADAPGWTYAYVKEGRVAELDDGDVATANMVLVTRTGSLSCKGELWFQGVTLDWVRHGLSSLLDYCASVKAALWHRGE